MKTVFTTGCFDLFHGGHMSFLLAARALGDKLVVGLETDESVRKLKGHGRPVEDFETRKKALLATGFISEVVALNEPMGEIITRVRPTLYAKGADQFGKGSYLKTFKAWDIPTVFIDHYNVTHTTDLVQPI